MNNLPIFIPEKTEQEAIVRLIAGSEKIIKDNIKGLQKRQELKTALMQDLLTGNKRIIALLDEREAES